MTKPQLFLGGADLLQANQGYNDGGEAYELALETNPIAPAGVGGECIFTSAYVVLTFDTAFRLRVIPILDGLPVWSEAYDIANTGELVARQTHRFEIPLRLRYTSQGKERVQALRGTWFALRIEMPCPMSGEGDLILEGFRVDVQVVSESGAAA